MYERQSKVSACRLREPHIVFVVLGLECGERFVIRTEKLLAATAFLVNLNEARLQLLYRWYVVGKDTHFSRLCRNVDLNTATPKRQLRLFHRNISSELKGRTYTSVDL